MYLSVDSRVHDLLAPGASALERRWVERMTSQRLHQAAFRGQVLLAYQSTCAICRLRHPEFLDAAHIIVDRETGGEPVVENGLTLCKIHHAAYDRCFLGISPDYRVHIDLKLLEETDGPMLKHGLQAMHGTVLTLPHARRDRPDPERLEMRFSRFLENQQ